MQIRPPVILQKAITAPRLNRDAQIRIVRDGSAWWRASSSIVIVAGVETGGEVVGRVLPAEIDGRDVVCCVVVGGTVGCVLGVAFLGEGGSGG